MPRKRGVTHKTDTLQLSDGDHLVVKSSLSAGEENDLTFRSVRGYSQNAEGKLRTDPDTEKMSFVMAAIYIVAWTLIGQDDRPIVWTINASLDEKIAILRGLDAETWAEVNAAVAAHRKQHLSETEKNANSGGSGSGTSPSPSAAPSPVTPSPTSNA